MSKIERIMEQRKGWMREYAIEKKAKLLPQPNQRDIEQEVQKIQLRAATPSAILSRAMPKSTLKDTKPEVQSLMECTNCFTIMRIPMMIVPCGHSFCETCISKHSQSFKNCPVCRKKVDSLVRNVALQKIVENFLIKGNEQVTGAYLEVDDDQEIAALMDKYHEDYGKIKTRCDILKLEQEALVNDLQAYQIQLTKAASKAEQMDGEIKECDAIVREYELRIQDLTDQKLQALEEVEVIQSTVAIHHRRLTLVKESAEQLQQQKRKTKLLLQNMVKKQVY